MKQRGFSLIELMVAVGILILINAIIFASYPEFSQKMALKRTSEEIALIVRQAKSYSWGIKRPASADDDYFGFGIHFDKSDPKSLILFTDLNNNKFYNAEAGELFQKFTIDTGDTIFDLQTCDSSLTCESIIGDKLDVFYPRTTSLATITADGGSTNHSYAIITIKSPRGDADRNKKLIKIWRSGPISVE